MKKPHERDERLHSESEITPSRAQPSSQTSRRKPSWSAGLRDLLASLSFAVTGKVRVTGWVNVYRSGYYHRAGKPGVFDRHPGDVYPTREAAVADIEPAHLYVATVKISWFEGFAPHVNAADSKPVPVASSRRVLSRERGEYVDGAWVPQSQLEAERLAAARLELVQASFANPFM